MNQYSLSAMSYSRTKNTKTSFCKICFDLRKPKSVYTSHYVRQTPHPESVVTCPVLLANVCRHCNMTGHFVGACPKAKREARESREERIVEERQRRKHEERVESSQRVSKNSFAAICDDSDDEDEVVHVAFLPLVKKKILNWAEVGSDSEGEE